MGIIIEQANEAISRENEGRIGASVTLYGDKGGPCSRVTALPGQETGSTWTAQVAYKLKAVIKQ
jgi:hypothetical protein